LRLHPSTEWIYYMDLDLEDNLMRIQVDSDPLPWHTPMTHSLKSRRDRQDMALAHKHVMSERQGLFTNRGARTRRVAGERCLVKQFARTDTRKSSFAVRAVDNWNELPESVRAEEKLKGLAA
jgi:hypothetical protein